MAPNELSLKQFLLRVLHEHSGSPAFSIYRKEWITHSYRDVLDLTLVILGEIRAANLGKEDKVAIILDSCPEYAPSFFASGMLGHTTLLLDSKLTPEEMKQIISHSDSKLIITGFSARSSVDKLQAILPASLPVVSVDTLRTTSRTILEIETELSDLRGLQSQDIAVLVYTSGTTSEPKGVMLSLENIFFDGRATIQAVRPEQGKYTLLSILPLNHMFEFNCGMLAQVHLGSHVVYANTLLPHEIMERLKAFAFTDMVVVPLFLRSIRAALMREVNKKLVKRLYFALAFRLARIFTSQDLRRKLFAPVVKKFGGINHFMTGGAAVEKSTQEFFTLMGFTVTQGYGLTETSPVSTANYKGEVVLGSQGRAIPGTEIKSDEITGEILIRGPHLMKGYYKKPELTAQVFNEEGWFKSGDIGHIDAKGNLFITGRLKELIVLGNGKKVFPDEVESLMEISANIKEVIIVGAQEKTGPLAGTESVCAVVVPTEELMKRADIMIIRDIVETEIRKRAEKIAAYKRPSRIFLSFQELPKTNTRKNKRTLIKRMIEEGVFDEPRLPHHNGDGLYLHNSTSPDILSGRREVQPYVVGNGVSAGTVSPGSDPSGERLHS